MVVCYVTSSSFPLIFLLLSLIKSCGFSESIEHKDSCTANIYKSRSRFCPKGRDSMNTNMGNLISCTRENKAQEKAENEEPINNAEKKVDGEKQTSKSKEGVKENQKMSLTGHVFREVDGKHVLEDIETGKSFEFDVHKGDRTKNQWRYEDIGEAITEYVYEYLEDDLGLKKVTIPVDAKENDPKGFFFMSDDALESEKLMILIHSSGVVRAGQWARSLIINYSFESGTMVPYIERARQEGYGVLITNGNHNYDDKLHKRIKGSENPQDHFVYVWKNFIKKAKAKDIVIVAHSFGGNVVLHGVRNIKEAVDRIKAVAFTDSVHSVGFHESSKIKKWFKQRTRNWVSSYEKLDTPVRPYYDDDSCDLVSAGTTEHVWTSHCAKDSVFKFFKEKLEEDKKKTGQYEEQEQKQERRQREGQWQEH